MFFNAVRIMVLVSDVQYHVPIKLCKTAESIHHRHAKTQKYQIKLILYFGHSRNRLEGCQCDFQ